MKFLRNNRLFLALLIPFMVIPWVRIGNFHLLLFNFSHNRLEFLGFGIEIGTYTLIGIVVLLGFGITLTVALTLSRFYCGMLCPNTFFAHFLTLLRSKKKSILSKIGGFLLLTVLASMLAFSVVAYGIRTDELMDAIAHLSFSGCLVIFLSLLMIAEVYMLQGWYCAYLCPYGAMCAILPIDDRLTYTYEDSKNQCIACEGCVKICPIPDLDIRKGFDIRCIQCGLCEVACAKTFAKNPTITTLISYDQRSRLRAGGRDRGILIAIVVMVLLTMVGVITLLDTERLQSCRLENQILH